MKEILIFAGTTEGRKLSEVFRHTVCVATEYGEIVLNDQPYVSIHRGRMNQDEMKTFIQNGSFSAVVDATHPYAKLVTENIKTAVNGMNLPCLRLLRENEIQRDETYIKCFDSSEACAEALKETEGNILLTTGSKELGKFCVSEEVKQRLFVRVLPGMESLSLCNEQGISGKQIIAMQGPFSEEMNLALIHQFGIACMVTKESGRTGGYQEKLTAAKKAGIQVYVIQNPEKESGYSFLELCKKLEEICETKLKTSDRMEIILAGIGMGNQKNLTLEVQEAIKNADILLGAERMLKSYSPKAEKRPYYLSKQILPYLKEVQKTQFFSECCKVVVLFSGDSGFYSGCQSLYQSLKAEIEKGELQASVRILPGISSVAYLAACTGESYQDAEICSIHGKDVPNLAEKILHSKKVFLLMSGVSDVNKLGELLLKHGLNMCEIIVGYQLSYAEQEILYLTPKECKYLKKEGLYICLIKNLNAVSKRLTHGKTDEEFIRDKVPMTKEEVREVSICKLHLCENAVVYDIGSGTGSIAVEMAGLSDSLYVYAIEQKSEALALIEKNKEKFGLQNIEVVEAAAPEGLEKLPVATHAFIGGTGGQMKEILGKLYQINPQMRIVINAVSLESICEIKECLEFYPTEEAEIVQIQVSRAKKAGKYHLMRAENPIWICAFNFINNGERNV